MLVTTETMIYGESFVFQKQIRRAYMSFIQIAVDGPSGAGKSTLAKIVAKKMGITYLDTGAMYRAIALKAIRKGISFFDEKSVTELADHTSLDIVYDEAGQRVLLEDEDITGLIRTNEVSMGASAVSAHAGVRARLVSMQQKIAGSQSVIMDGRDIGTHVLPMATVKIFLTASPEDRATRRFEELKEKKMLDKSYDELLEDIKLRDLNDSTRAASPLKQADDAVLLDTTGCSIETSIRRIMKIIEDKTGKI
jgi:cytidylate kinase